jgi:hypothetical protein
MERAACLRVCERAVKRKSPFGRASKPASNGNDKIHADTLFRYPYPRAKTHICTRARYPSWVENHARTLYSRISHARERVPVPANLRSSCRRVVQAAEQIPCGGGRSKPPGAVRRPLTVVAGPGPRRTPWRRRGGPPR